MMSVLRVTGMYILILTIINLLFVDCVPLCGVEQFFDTDTDLCDYCYTICDHPELTDTLVKCLNKCPGYRTDKQTSTLKGVTTEKAQITLSTSSLSVTDPLPGLKTDQIASIVVSVMTAVIVIAVVVVVVYKRRTKQKRNQDNEKKFPVQVKDEDGPTETAVGVEQKKSLITASTSTVNDCCMSLADPHAL